MQDCVLNISASILTCSLWLLTWGRDLMSVVSFEVTLGREMGLQRYKNLIFLELMSTLPTVHIFF